MLIIWSVFAITSRRNNVTPYTGLNTIPEPRVTKVSKLDNSHANTTAQHMEDRG